MITKNMNVLSIEKCPYRCLMYWYVWDEKHNRATVFNTKAEAVKHGKQLLNETEVAGNHYRLFNVGWIENSMRRTLGAFQIQQCISKGCEIIDNRKKK